MRLTVTTWAAVLALNVTKKRWTTALSIVEIFSHWICSNLQKNSATVPTFHKFSGALDLILCRRHQIPFSYLNGNCKLWCYRDYVCCYEANRSLFGSSFFAGDYKIYVGFLESVLYGFSSFATDRTSSLARRSSILHFPVHYMTSNCIVAFLLPASTGLIASSTYAFFWVCFIAKSA